MHLAVERGKAQWTTTATAPFHNGSIGHTISFRAEAKDRELGLAFPSLVFTFMEIDFVADADQMFRQLFLSIHAIIFWAVIVTHLLSTFFNGHSNEMHIISEILIHNKAIIHAFWPAVAHGIFINQIVFLILEAIAHHTHIILNTDHLDIGIKDHRCILFAIFVVTVAQFQVPRHELERHSCICREVNLPEIEFIGDRNSIIELIFIRENPTNHIFLFGCKKNEGVCGGVVERHLPVFEDGHVTPLERGLFFGFRIVVAAHHTERGDNHE